MVFKTVMVKESKLSLISDFYLTDRYRTQFLLNRPVQFLKQCLISITWGWNDNVQNLILSI